MNIKISISHIGIYCALFIFLYDPPLLKYNLLLHILCLFSLFNIFKSHKYVRKFISTIIETRIWKFSLVLFFISIYLLVYDCISSRADVSYGRIYIYIVIATELIVIAFYVTLYYWKNKKKYKEIIKDILLVGNIQGLIALIAYISPSIKEKLIEIMFANGVDRINEYLLSVRFYGFANYLTSTTAILQIILAVIAVWFFLEESYKFVLYVPLLIFSAIINARSAIVIGVIGIAIIILFKINLKNKKIWREILGAIVIIAIIINIVMPKLYSLTSWEWIQEGIEEIISFLKGDEVGYFEYLSNSLIFPEKDYQFLFGTGHAIFRGEINSDVGYINDIWMIGFILTLFLYTSFLSVILRKIRSCNLTFKFMKVFLVATFLIYNIKGIVIGNNEIVRICILLCLTQCLLVAKRKE